MLSFPVQVPLNVRRHQTMRARTPQPLWQPLGILGAAHESDNAAAAVAEIEVEVEAEVDAPCALHALLAMVQSDSTSQRRCLWRLQQSSARLLGRARNRTPTHCGSRTQAKPRVVLCRAGTGNISYPVPGYSVVILVQHAGISCQATSPTRYLT